MADIVDIIKGVFSDSLGFWKKRGERFIVDLVKINILEWAVFVIPVVILISLAMIMLGSISLDETEAASALLGNIAFLAIAFILLFITYLVSAALGSVMLNAVDNRAKGKETHIIRQFKANFVPYSLYVILIGLISFVIFIPLIVGFLMAGGDGGPGAILRILGSVCLFGFLSGLIYILFVFFIQFSKFELIIERTGVVDSLKRSYSLVRRNIVGVFIFNIIYIIIAFAIGSISSVIERILIVALQLMMVGGSITGAIFAGLLYVVIVFVISVLTTFVMLPLLYFFWKRIKTPQKEKGKKKMKG